MSWLWETESFQFFILWKRHTYLWCISIISNLYFTLKLPQPLQHIFPTSRFLLLCLCYLLSLISASHMPIHVSMCGLFTGGVEHLFLPETTVSISSIVGGHKKPPPNPFFWIFNWLDLVWVLCNCGYLHKTYIQLFLTRSGNIICIIPLLTIFLNTHAQTHINNKM